MALFAGPESDPTKLRALFDRVYPIVAAFSQVLAAQGTAQGARGVSTLPHSKSRISNALLEWLTILTKSNTIRTLEEHMPELIAEVASPESVESLVVQYLYLCYFIDDRDAQIFMQVANGDFDGLSTADVDRTSRIREAIMRDRGEREAEIRKLGYPIPGQ